MKVFLNDPIAPSALERLRKHVEIVNNYDYPEELDAIIVRQQYCQADVIRKAAKCRIIQQHGVGLDRIDLKAAEECGIKVRNTPGTNARSVAEYTIALMLAAARKVVLTDRKTRAGQLTSFGMAVTVGFELSGKKLGLVGSGHIACETARIAANGFMMEILCYDPFRPAAQIEGLGFKPVSSLKELFRVSDFVSLHCLLTPESRHMISAEVFAGCNPDLILINTARGGLIDEKALYDALVTGKLAGAGLDVFEKEPPAPDSPLLQLEQLTAGMHVGGSTREALERTGNAAVDSVFAELGIAE